MIWQDGATFYANVWSTKPSDGSRSDLRSYSSLEAARAESVEYTYDTETQQIKVEDRCLHLATGQGDIYLWTCSETDQQKWTFDEDGTLRSAHYGDSRKVGRVYSTYGVKRAAFVTNSSWSTVDSYGRLTAEVSEVDLEGGAATVSGSAPPDATNVLLQWTNEAGKSVQKYVSVTDGRYSAILSGLKIGTTPVNLTAYNGGEMIATTSVDVKLEVAPVIPTYTFPEDVRTVVQVSGTAQPNTNVTIKHGEKDLVTVPTDSEGNWSTPINAPNMPGVYNLTVGQEIRGEDNGRVELDIDYGPGVAITSPGQDFVLDPGEALAITGTAPKGTEITVHEKDETEVLGSAKAGSNNSFLVPIEGLEDREYTLVAEGITRGYNRTHADLRINPGKNVIAPIDGSLTFPGALTDDAHVVGTAEPGAAISIKNGDDDIAAGAANGDGAFDIAIPTQGPGEHTLTLVETKGDANASKEIVANFGAAVDAQVDGSTTFPGSSVTIEGTGADDSRIVVTENGKQVAETTVQDGTFSVPVERIQDGQHTYVVTQTAPGNTTSESEVVATRDAPVTDVTLTSPKSGDTYPARSTVRFEGTGTPGAKVVLDAYYGLADFETTVGWDGNWHIDRPMNTGTYKFDVVQTAKGDKVSRIDGVELDEEGAQVDRPFAVTAPADGSEHRDETVTFKGTGTAGSTITIDPKDPALQTIRTTVKQNGYWAVDRYLGKGAYEFDVIQTTDEQETGRQTLRINQPASVTKPFAVTSPEEGSIHRNETVTFAGTGTPGSTITIDPKNPALATRTTTVEDNGTWAVERYLGAGAYEFEITQTTHGQLNGSTTLHLNDWTDPVDKEFAVTSHHDGDTFTPDTYATFAGTGVAGAQVELDPGPGLAKVSATVGSDGSWTVNKYLGNGAYTFTATQTAGDQVTTLPPFTITPKP